MNDKYFSENFEFIADFSIEFITLASTAAYNNGE